MPIDALRQDDVIVGRIRRRSAIPRVMRLDFVESGINCEGAALNAIQIAESAAGTRSWREMNSVCGHKRYAPLPHPTPGSSRAAGRLPGRLVANIVQIEDCGSAHSREAHRVTEQ